MMDKLSVGISVSLTRSVSARWDGSRRDPVRSVVPVSKTWDLMTEDHVSQLPYDERKSSRKGSVDRFSTLGTERIGRLGSHASVGTGTGTGTGIGTGTGPDTGISPGIGPDPGEDRERAPGTEHVGGTVR